MRGWMLAAAVGMALAGAAPAGAAETFYIRGGGDGHGIGMSQYGAYGYALHGKDYRFILGHYYTGTSLGSTSPSQLVRVLIRTGSASFAGANRAAGQKLNPAATYSVRTLASGALGVFDSSGKRVVSAASPLRVTGSGPLRVGGSGSYHGALEFRPSGRSAVETINAVGLEDYVRGVISAEMPASWSAQALEAQAVAARTYAITTGVGANGYQLYSDTRSQMYQGVAAETPSTDAAVAATRGQVVTYRGRPVVTYFFASSGGQTEDIQNVWLGSSPEPWLHGVSDPYDGVGGNPDHRWTVKLTVGQAASRLSSLVKGRLIGVRVTRWGVSPRVVSAQIVGSRGTTNVTGPQLQQAFGLMSTYMAFASISSSQGTPGSSVGSTTGGTAFSSQLPTHTTLAVAAAGFEALPAGPRVLRGNVSPARRGERLGIESRVAGRWRSVARVRARSGGAYRLKLHHRGLYRVVWHGLDGPAITVR
jgi:stage II sporulation protein D